MTWSDTVYLLPEIIIAIGACAAADRAGDRFPQRGERRRSGRCWRCSRITAVSVVVCSQRGREHRSDRGVRGDVRARRVLDLLQAAVHRHHRHGHAAVGRLPARHALFAVGVLLAAGLRALRHDVHGLGHPPGVDLRRPGADVAVELHPGRLLQERAEEHRGGDEVLRARRGELGDSAVRDLADLRRDAAR